MICKEVDSMTYDYDYFKKAMFDLTKIDLEAYKEKQMKRRIDTLISKHKYKGYQDYIAAIKTDKDLMDEFLGYMTINVSEFYRDPLQWQFLDKEVFPELIRKFGKNLKIWSAACSTGDEPYSLVMALSRHLPLANIRIYATDLDKVILEKAKVGLYAEKSLVGVPKDLKAKYFTKVGSSYRISDEIKKRVTFKQHNLIKDRYEVGYHLIVCRNVLIYFTEEAKDEVFTKYYKSLVSGGVLFIGSTEQIMNYKEIGYDRKSSFFYAKP